VYALDAMVPEPLKRCPPFVEFVTSVNSRCSDALDLIAPGWRTRPIHDPVDGGTE
jgi:hypothetical protein